MPPSGRPPADGCFLHRVRVVFFWTWSGKKRRDTLVWLERDVIAWEDKLRALVAKFPKNK